jgi:enamine deaminase RidA (YjgF/YER057c/UK114 family)
MEALLAVSAIRSDYYARNSLPAGTWVQVEGLIDPGLLVEIAVTAELP